MAVTLPHNGWPHLPIPISLSIFQDPMKVPAIEVLYKEYMWSESKQYRQDESAWDDEGV